MSGFLSSGIVNADTLPDSVMVHGFEDQDLSNYDSYNTVSENVVSTPALHESYSLEIGASSGGPSTLYSGSGLDVYPQQGNSWAVKMRYNSGARDDGIVTHGWAGQSSGQNPSGLCVRFEFANRLGNGTGFSIAKNNEGQVYEFLDVNFDDEDVYRVEIAWYEDNTIQALLYNETDNVKEGEITATTSDYTSQGAIWWSVGNNQSTFYYDNADVSELQAI